MNVDCLAYTDASLHKPEEKAGAGGIILYEDKKVKLKRVFPCTNVNAAESRAIYLTTRLAHELRDISSILVKTDSEAAIHAWNNGFKGRGIKHEFRREMDRLRGWLGNTNLDFSLEWVKGHQSEDTWNARLNGRADELAKKAVRPYVRDNISALPEDIT